MDTYERCEWVYHAHCTAHKEARARRLEINRKHRFRLRHGKAHDHVQVTTYRTLASIRNVLICAT